MSLKSSKQEKTIAEKVAASLMKPQANDSDDAGTLSSSNEDEAPIVERFNETDYDDFKPSRGTTEFRKKTAKLLSEQSARYKGKITSRNELNLNCFESEQDSHSEFNDTSDNVRPNIRKKRKVKYESEIETANGDPSDDSDNSESDGVAEDEMTDSENTDDDEGDDDDEDDDGDDHDDDVNHYYYDKDNNDDDDDDNNDDVEIDEDNDNDNDQHQNIVNQVDREAEIQKGFCVKNQLNLWERLLELRIHSQKLLTKANQLMLRPSKNQEQQEQQQQLNCDDVAEKEEEGEALEEQPELINCEKESSLNVMKLLEQLIQLQNALIKQNPELNDALTKATNRKRAYPFKEQFHQDEEDIAGIPFTEIDNYLQEKFTAFRSYRDAVLLKWDDRTKLLMPGAITKKSKANEENYDILKKIQNSLLNKRLLIRKSQQVKSNEQIPVEPGGKQAKQQMPEQNGNESESLMLSKMHYESNAMEFKADIYDDSDFYHQQLRELIEYKANMNTTNLHEVTKQFIELQKIRQKMKKKVDTRASKGRKLRYVVHKKLVNFMAPNDITTWTNDSKDELYRSLFV